MKNQRTDASTTALHYTDDYNKELKIRKEGQYLSRYNTYETIKAGQSGAE